MNFGAYLFVIWIFYGFYVMLFSVIPDYEIRFTVIPDYET